MSTATATVAPQETVKKAPLELTPQAIAKVREIMATQDPLPAGLRIGVVGGGCSGFQYSMSFENQSGMMDKVYDFDGLKVFLDATSMMYLNGCVVDYVETIEAAGFKFENPTVKSTCGCGSSLQGSSQRLPRLQPALSHSESRPVIPIAGRRAFAIAVNWASSDSTNHCHWTRYCTSQILSPLHSDCSRRWDCGCFFGHI